MLQWGTSTWKLTRTTWHTYTKFQYSTCFTQSRLVSWVRFGAGAEIHRLSELHSGISQSIAIVVDSLHLVQSSALILDEQNFQYIHPSLLLLPYIWQPCCFFVSRHCFLKVSYPMVIPPCILIVFWLLCSDDLFVGFIDNFVVMIVIVIPIHIESPSAIFKLSVVDSQTLGPTISFPLWRWWYL